MAARQTGNFRHNNGHPARDCMDVPAAPGGRNATALNCRADAASCYRDTRASSLEGTIWAPNRPALYVAWLERLKSGAVRIYRCLLNICGKVASSAIRRRRLEAMLR